MSELNKILILGTLDIAERKILDLMRYGDIFPKDVEKIFEDLRKSILEGEEEE